MAKSPIKDELRKRLFAALYVGRCRMNGVEAAKASGYRGDRKALAVRSAEMLNDPAVRAEIDSRIEKAGTDQEEVLGIMVQHMRGDMGDFINIRPDGYASIDLVRARDFGRLNLIRKFKEKVRIDKEGCEERTYEIELYDAQTATALVGKALGMFVERKQVEVVKKTDDAAIVGAYISLGVVRDKWAPGILARYDAGMIEGFPKKVLSTVTSAGSPAS